MPLELRNRLASCHELSLANWSESGSLSLQTEFRPLQPQYLPQEYGGTGQYLIGPNMLRSRQPVSDAPLASTDLTYMQERPSVWRGIELSRCPGLNASF
jgi:hypothetical protein